MNSFINELSCKKFLIKYVSECGVSTEEELTSENIDVLARFIKINQELQMEKMMDMKKEWRK